MAANEDGIRLRRPTEMNVSDIADSDHSKTRLLDRETVEGRDVHRRGVGLHQVVDGTDLLVAGWQYDVLSRECARHILSGKPISQKFLLIEIHFDVVWCASVGSRNRDAGD